MYKSLSVHYKLYYEYMHTFTIKPIEMWSSFVMNNKPDTSFINYKEHVYSVSDHKPFLTARKDTRMMTVVSRIAYSVFFHQLPHLPPA